MSASTSDSASPSPRAGPQGDARTANASADHSATSGKHRRAADDRDARATDDAMPSQAIDPHVRFRMRIHHDGSIAIGPGKVALLEAVRERGSISAAARHLNMSYRRAWMLIDELNRSLEMPATHAEMGGRRGGGCVLTPVGESIVALYRGIEETAYAACTAQIHALDKLLKR